MSAKAPFSLELPPRLVETSVATALAEDLGGEGDITSDPIVPAEAQGEAACECHENPRMRGARPRRLHDSQ